MKPFVVYNDCKKIQTVKCLKLILLYCKKAGLHLGIKRLTNSLEWNILKKGSLRHTEKLGLGETRPTKRLVGNVRILQIFFFISIELKGTMLSIFFYSHSFYVVRPFQLSLVGEGHDHKRKSKNQLLMNNYKQVFCQCEILLIYYTSKHPLRVFSHCHIFILAFFSPTHLKSMPGILKFTFSFFQRQKQNWCNLIQPHPAELQRC